MKPSAFSCVYSTESKKKPEEIFMKTKTALFGLMMLAAFSSLACYGSVFGARVRGSGKVVEEERAIENVKTVTLATFGDLTIEIGEEETLRIEAEDNVMDYIETEVSGGRLTIKASPNVSLSTSQPVRFYLTVKALEEIKNTGSGDIYAPNLEAVDFSVIVTGSGDVTLESVKATEADVTLTGSGDLTLDEIDAEWLKVRITGSGSAEINAGLVADLNVTMNSSGDLEMNNVESETAAVVLTGSGSADLWASETLDVRISGSGDISYRGRPRISSSMSGSGSLNAQGE
jgi:hypothetical protein